MSEGTAGGDDVNGAATEPLLSIVYRDLRELKPNPRNAKKHSKKQLQRLAESIRAFGFCVPILIDILGVIIAGHARLLAAELLGIKVVPTICLSDLTDAQTTAFMIADNRLCEIGEWDDHLLGEQLKGLSEINLSFQLESTGFEMAEIDLFIQGLSPAIGVDDPADQIPETTNEAPVTKPGDLWILDRHRVLCGDVRDFGNFENLMAGKPAGIVVTDPPYNVRIEGHASGKGAVKHADFVMASGELSRDEFTAFLSGTFASLVKCTNDGALAFVFMDWRHMGEVLEAGEEVFSELKNLCIWTKDRAGMGSLYRSQHEIVFVFKIGSAAHVNNIQLGQFGRSRSNVWSYPSAASFGHAGDEGNLLALHPTVKPVAMIADAILDCSNRGDVVLDPFLGSGTTVVAAEKTGRACFGMEIDPKYVDVCVRRWQKFTGKAARHFESGCAFHEIEGRVTGVRL